METLSSLASVMLINVVLSGDNAVVIGMAAAPLTDARRRTAIVIGGGVAIILRIVLTWLAAELLQIPALNALGGLLLLWIAVRLLQREEASAEGSTDSGTLWGAVVTIAVADLVMSVDNVLGVAAAARGSTSLLIFGLIVSMAIVVAGGGGLASIIDRFRWLAYLGAAVIAWTGARMVLADPWVLGGTAAQSQAGTLISGAVTLTAVLVAHRLRHRRGYHAHRIPATLAVWSRHADQGNRGG